MKKLNLAPYLIEERLSIKDALNLMYNKDNNEVANMEYANEIMLRWQDYYGKYAHVISINVFQS